MSGRALPYDVLPMVGIAPAMGTIVSGRLDARDVVGAAQLAHDAHHDCLAVLDVIHSMKSTR